MPNMIRQGDILFISTESIPETAKPREDGSLVIAEGEATGHHHALAEAEGVEVFENKVNWQNSDLYIRVTAVEMPVVHEEHATVKLPAGSYKVHRAREFDYAQEAARIVAD